MINGKKTQSMYLEVTVMNETKKENTLLLFMGKLQRQLDNIKRYELGSSAYLRS